MIKKVLFVATLTLLFWGQAGFAYDFQWSSAGVLQFQDKKVWKTS